MNAHFAPMLPNCRIYSLDMLRIIACIMVVLMHSAMPMTRGDGHSLLLSSVNYLSAPCIGLFFMVSGALILPVNCGTKAFFTRRLGKVAIPTLFWSLFYLALHLFNGDDVNVVRSLLSLPFTAQGSGILWFMYTLIGLYLLAPILSRWLTSVSRNELRFYLMLWVVTLCYPLLGLVIDINTTNTGLLYYFTGFAGYFVLGYYLHRYPDDCSWLWLLPAVALVVGVPIVCKVFAFQVDFYTMFWYLSIFVAIQCVCWWKVTTRLASHIHGTLTILTRVSCLSFGIYFVHIFFARHLLWHMEWITSIRFYALQLVVITVLTFVFSLMLCHIISLLPGARYIIGYEKKPSSIHKGEKCWHPRNRVYSSFKRRTFR